MSKILEVKNLSKAYKSHWTFKKVSGISNISFHINEGETFALLGANGAGKTTTLKNILGFLRPDEGLISFRGEKLSLPVQRKQIGYLPEQPYFYDYLSVQETLDFYAALFSIPAKDRKRIVTSVMERLSISHKAKSKIKSLSKGQKQRVGLAQSIIGKPSLLILDEPFSGLDPISRVEIRNLLFDLKKEGVSMLVSSHILSDIEMLCDRAVILFKGEIKKEVMLSSLLNTESNSFKVILKGFSKYIKEASIENKATEILEEAEVRSHSDEIDVVTFSDYQKAKNLLEFSFSNNISILEFSRVQASLEDVFISVNKD